MRRSRKSSLRGYTLSQSVRNKECKMCGKIFSSAANLERHMRIHTGERQFVCEICEKTFNQQPHLQRHKLVHTGERPYACDICGNRFSLLHYLKTHKRCHTGEKPFACDVCGQRFTHSSHRNTHLRTHTGVKPYQCHICHQRFSRSDNLKNHIRAIHEAKQPSNIIQGKPKTMMSHCNGGLTREVQSSAEQLSYSFKKVEITESLCVEESSLHSAEEKCPNRSTDSIRSITAKVNQNEKYLLSTVTTEPESQPEKILDFIAEKEYPLALEIYEL